MEAATIDAEPKTTSLYELAREALEEHDGNKAKAIDRVFYRLRADQKLMRAIVADSVTFIISQKVQSAISHQRQRMIETGDKRNSRDAVFALAEGLADALLDFPLAGGIKLRNATRTELTTQIDYYETSAKNATFKARWLQLVRQSTPEGKTVGDALNEKRVQELFEEAKKA